MLGRRGGKESRGQADTKTNHENTKKGQKTQKKNPNIGFFSLFLVFTIIGQEQMSNASLGAES
jgi:hypothetical protein